MYLAGLIYLGFLWLAKSQCLHTLDTAVCAQSTAPAGFDCCVIAEDGTCSPALGSQCVAKDESMEEVAAVVSTTNKPCICSNTTAHSNDDDEHDDGARRRILRRLSNGTFSADTQSISEASVDGAESRDESAFDEKCVCSNSSLLHDQQSLDDQQSFDEEVVESADSHSDLDAVDEGSVSSLDHDANGVKNTSVSDNDVKDDDEQPGNVGDDDENENFGASTNAEQSSSGFASNSEHYRVSSSLIILLCLMVSVCLVCVCLICAKKLRLELVAGFRGGHKAIEIHELSDTEDVETTVLQNAETNSTVAN